ncbi:MAG: acyl-CoA/acyl-ACP dehydrogenase [Defluviitaleaceae bacterium]|nr:acyl-CoA/acyl-ACP dehydrogenase [Defluviitaleaceae bacterium]
MWYITRERKLLQSIVREFVETEIVPFIPELEKGIYPLGIIKRLGGIGVLGLCHDTKYGGHGVDYINWYIALEEISKASSAVALLAAQTSELCAHFCEDVCTPEQVEKYIKPAVRGEIILGQFATEHSGMITVADFNTTAVRDGDDWVINGSKIFSTNAGVCDYAMVLCRTSQAPDPATMRGASMFMVHKSNPGYVVGHIENKLGWHGTSTGQTYFNDCRVPSDALIGEVDGYLPELMKRFTPGLGLYAALSLGCAEAVYRKTRTFLDNRVQAGVSLWDRHQVVRNQMSQMWMQIETLRCALYGYAEMQNKGMDVTGLGIALKVEGTKVAKSVCDTCLTLHGGIGTVNETGIERYYRDVKMFDFACGSNFSLVDALAVSL